MTIHIKTLDGILTTSTNIAIVPAIIHAIQEKEYASAALWFVIGSISTFYHICQAEFYCLTSFDIHQISDHFFVWSGGFWALLRFIGFPLPLRLAIFFVVQALLLPALMSWKENWWFGVIIVVAMLWTLGLFFERFLHYHRNKVVYYSNLIVAITLLLVSFAFHLSASDVSTHFYAWTHSIWHVYAMLAIYFLNDVRYGRSWIAQFFAGQQLRFSKHVDLL